MQHLKPAWRRQSWRPKQIRTFLHKISKLARILQMAVMNAGKASNFNQPSILAALHSLSQKKDYSRINNSLHMIHDLFAWNPCVKHKVLSSLPRVDAFLLLIYWPAVDTVGISGGHERSILRCLHPVNRGRLFLFNCWLQFSVHKNMD